jgi:hypothetical protein
MCDCTKSPLGRFYVLRFSGYYEWTTKFMIGIAVGIILVGSQNSQLH